MSPTTVSNLLRYFLCTQTHIKLKETKNTCAHTEREGGRERDRGRGRGEKRERERERER